LHKQYLLPRKKEAQKPQEIGGLPKKHEQSSLTAMRQQPADCCAILRYRVNGCNRLIYKRGCENIVLPRPEVEKRRALSTALGGGHDRHM